MSVLVIRDRAHKMKHTVHVGEHSFAVDEPPAKTHPVFSLPNVTLTPHSAGPTWENWTARYRNGFDNIQRVASGERPRWVIPELA